jgi:hypothetical protein
MNISTQLEDLSVKEVKRKKKKSKLPKLGLDVNSSVHDVESKALKYNQSKIVLKKIYDAMENTPLKSQNFSV